MKQNKSKHYLEDTPRKITYTVSAFVTVGYRNCFVCGVETPPPTTNQLLEYAREYHDGFLWPGTDPEQFMPSDWMWTKCQTDSGLICPECAETQENALESRRREAIDKDQ